jgi:drug/metabolite transporter (DMT)-like permease
MNNHHWRASSLVILSAILYGFMGYLGTHIVDNHISMDAMLFWRFLIAGCWMLPFLLGTHTGRQKLFHLHKRTVIWILTLGALGYAGSSGFYFASSQYIGTGLGMVIFFSYPAMIALASWFFYGSKLTLTIILTLITMLWGLYLLHDASHQQINVLGIVFGLLSAASYAFYLIGSKHSLAGKLDATVATLLVCIGCAFLFLILTLVKHHFAYPPSWQTWGYCLVLGVIATALPIQLMLEGLKHISAMRAGIISVLEPLVTVFLGVWLLHEAISIAQMFGTIVILASAVLIQFKKEL